MSVSDEAMKLQQTKSAVGEEFDKRVEEVVQKKMQDIKAKQFEEEVNAVYQRRYELAINEEADRRLETFMKNSQSNSYASAQASTGDGSRSHLYSAGLTTQQHLSASSGSGNANNNLEGGEYADVGKSKYADMFYEGEVSRQIQSSFDILAQERKLEELVIDKYRPFLKSKVMQVISAEVRSLMQKEKQKRVVEIGKTFTEPPKRHGGKTQSWRNDK